MAGAGSATPRYSTNGGPGCYLLVLTGIGVGGYFTSREAHWFWWLLGGLVALVVLRSAVSAVVQAHVDVLYRRIREAGEPAEIGWSPARSPSGQTSPEKVRVGCTPAVVVAVLTWHFGSRWWGTEIRLAAALAVFVVLLSATLRWAAHRLRTGKPPPST
jgi:hypothetical protein